jgi:hypothetical protein
VDYSRMKIRSQNLSIDGGNMMGVSKKLKNLQEKRAEFFFVFEEDVEK